MTLYNVLKLLKISKGVKVFMGDEKNLKDEATINTENLEKVSGGAGGSYGYCPYTTDRGCKLEIVGGFDNDNEECKYCGWRAW